MNHLIWGSMVAALGCGLVSVGIAGEPQASSSPQPTQAETPSKEAPVKTPSTAEVRAEIHRTLAALIEAQAVSEPNQDQITELTKKLAQLRGKLAAQRAGTPGAGTAGWVCPWGGPGRGPGMGRGAGLGPGRGRGFGVGGGSGGAAFVDEDGDGLCDYYEVRHGLHQK